MNRVSLSILAACALLLPRASEGAPLAIAYSVGAGSGALETFDLMGPSGTRAPGVANGAQWDSYWGLALQGFAADPYASLLLPLAMSNGAYNGGPVAGAADDFDRALGFYLTNSGAPTRQATARFQNDTGAALGSFELEFDVEYWIQRTSPRWGGVQAYVSLNGTTWTNLGNTFESTLVNVANTGWVDGNAAANSSSGVGGLVDLTALGLGSIAPGASFYVRFDGTNGLTTPPSPGPGFANRNVGVFLDNVWVGTTARPGIPVPEPTALLLLLAGLLGLATFAPRRRRAHATDATRASRAG